MGSSVPEMLARMRANAQNVRFSELCKVCDHYFGTPQMSGGSHRLYAMPWPGDPRVNIQNAGGKAKAYQVKQVLLAVERWEVDHGSSK